MAEAVNVKWPGQQIADDSTHRLVTDTQIERWDKSVVDYIDLDATSDLDIDSLQDGKYRIKFGFDSYKQHTASSDTYGFQGYDSSFKMLDINNKILIFEELYKSILVDLKLLDIINKITPNLYNYNYHGSAQCNNTPVLEYIYLIIAGDRRDISIKFTVYNSLLFINNDPELDHNNDVFTCDYDPANTSQYTYDFVQYAIYNIDYYSFEYKFNDYKGNIQKEWSTPAIKHNEIYNDINVYSDFNISFNYITNIPRINFQQTDKKLKIRGYYNTVCDIALYHPLKLKINDTTTVTYDNTEDVEVDLSKLSQTSVITDWDSITSNGEYSSAAGATNAPTSDIAYMGSVVRGEYSITQKLYADTDDLTAVSEYIRRGKIAKDADNNETITWGDWYCIDYSVPTASTNE